MRADPFLLACPEDNRGGIRARGVSDGRRKKAMKGRDRKTNRDGREREIGNRELQAPN
jgi:hypothetical protein